jgi:hypothetical protein
VVINDFQPISLVGVQYKITAKILENILVQVIDVVISPEQSTFIKGRQILDGPILLNEIIDLFVKKKRKLMLFKINFAKAYKSLSWDFLFNIMAHMRFDSALVGWIRECLASSRASILINRNGGLDKEILCVLFYSLFVTPPISTNGIIPSWRCDQTRIRYISYTKRPLKFKKTQLIFIITKPK